MQEPQRERCSGQCGIGLIMMKYRRSHGRARPTGRACMRALRLFEHADMEMERANYRRLPASMTWNLSNHPAVMQPIISQLAAETMLLMQHNPTERQTNLVIRLRILSLGPTWNNYLKSNLKRRSIKLSQTPKKL